MSPPMDSSKNNGDSAQQNADEESKTKSKPTSIPIPNVPLSADLTDGASAENSPRDKKARNISPGNSPRDKVQQAAAEYMVAASPPKFVMMEELMQAANGMANMALAHEISVNHDFKLEQTEKSPHDLEQRIKKAAERAFWDILQERLDRDPPDYGMALQLLTDIKEHLFMILLPRQRATRGRIEEVLDPELIQQQVEHGALDFKKYADFVIDVMKKHCAPARDEVVAELSEIQATVPLFKRMFEVLELIRIDLANFQIAQLRPVLQQQSVSYEKQKFKDFLVAQRQIGIDGLEATKSWLNNAKSKAGSDVVAKVLEEAYLELLDWDENNVWPETSTVDLQRYMEVRYKAWHASFISSVLLLAVSSAGAALGPAEEFKLRLKQALTAILEGLSVGAIKDKMENVADQVIKEVREHLDKHGYRPLTTEAVDSLKQQVLSVYDSEHPVRKIMNGRMNEFFRSCFNATPDSGRLQVPKGMTAVSRELGGCAGQFMRLCNHNRAVFNDWYVDIITGSTDDTQPTSGQTEESQEAGSSSN